MSKGGSIPQAADPYQVARAQSQSNIQTALANARLGAVNQVTPYGTVTYNFGTPPPKPAAAAGANAAQGGLTPYQQMLLMQQLRTAADRAGNAGGLGMGGAASGPSGGAFAGGGGAGDLGAGSHGGQPTM